MEFTNSPDGINTLFLNKGEVGKFNQNQEQVIDHILEMVDSNFPDAYKRLNMLYNVKVSGNKPMAITRLEKFRKVRRFIRCNLLVSDNIPDITDDGRFNLEQVPCPLKGTGDCKEENIICNPKQATHLSQRELEIVDLICEPLSDLDISKRLFISLHTAVNHRKNILRKLNLHSKEEIIIWAFENGLRKREHE